MTLDEKLKLVMGYFGADQAYRKYARPKDSLADSAGFVPGGARTMDRTCGFPSSRGHLYSAAWVGQGL